MELFKGNEFAGRKWCVDNDVISVAALAGSSEFEDPRGYAPGQYLLTSLFNSIGADAFSSAMQEFYERYLDFQRQPTDEQVYRIFLKHTPADLVVTVSHREGIGFYLPDGRRWVVNFPQQRHARGLKKQR